MVARVQMKEWEQRGYEESDALRGLELSGSAAILAQTLTKTERLKVEELRHGVRIQSTSFVGRVELGGLVVTIEPKIARHELLRLFAYAYDLDDLHVYDDTAYGASDALFVDIVVRRLIAEVQRLCERGLHRTYVRVAEDLGSPRGAFDMRRLVSAVASGRASVPCVHHPRIEDHLLNRVVRAGLVVAARAANSGAVRVAASRAAAALEGIAAVPLSASLLVRAKRSVDRRVLHYVPALRLVEILWNGTSLDLEEHDHRIAIPGFLFDMNRFWQVLLGRLLRENLDDTEVVEDRAVQGALRYAPGFKHPRFRAPVARPDFVLVRKGKPLAILDAKYRDLWRWALPSGMLYQLATYASVQGPGGVATILYPTQAADAREVRIEVCPPAGGELPRATVVLRPVNVSRLVDILAGSTRSAERQAWVRGLSDLQQSPTGISAHVSEGA